MKGLLEKLNGQKFLKYLVSFQGSSLIEENEIYVRECHDYIEELNKKTLEIICFEDVLY